MIGRLTGLVIESAPGQLLLDVGGVGYEIEISLTTYAHILETQGLETQGLETQGLETQGLETKRPVTVHTHLVVRDDAHLLYGFASAGEREMFRTLIKVNGVGPRMALGILSGLDSASFARAVTGNDVKALTALPGVGKKTAERLIIEMRDKVDSFDVSGSDNPSTMTINVIEDAESALIGLGYRPQDAARAVSRVSDPAEDVESLIRQALKLLMQS
ncbi:MAG: Holliday junction branch migration protein RuvA [Gammaproteobacteria bacterium]|nr:Holliday junction branch migration protein RuvA [Gammaproteobacteria bacterium]MBT6573064.1 Holliday junction branch migration protein RuvA [Gammaproteobacteria bacterium]MBT6663994.1 Holliday junction branch migration protein RuvA [Gammaproteobacteria bacterium]